MERDLTAYAVVNDQANSDGSFVPPILAAGLSGKTSVTVPVNFEYVADAIQTADSMARFRVDIDAGEQLIYPDVVQVLRESAISGVGPRGPIIRWRVVWPSQYRRPIRNFHRCAHLFAGGWWSLRSVLCRGDKWKSVGDKCLGLWSSAEWRRRSNLALINTGEVDASTDAFRSSCSTAQPESRSTPSTESP